MEDFAAFVIILALITGFIVGMSQIFEADDHNACHERGDLASVEVTYRKWDGCYVKYQGAYDMPYDVWKYNRDHGIIAK